MSWEKSEILSEFLKIAEKQDLLGLGKNVKLARPEPNPYQEDLKTIEEKRQKSPEKSIIEIAHPEPVYVAEARGDGGLVENLVEQQKKYIEMLNKTPTGSLVGRYASSVHQLVRVANICESAGEPRAAEFLTVAAEQLLERLACIKSEDECSDCLPFDKAPEKDD